MASELEKAPERVRDVLTGLSNLEVVVETDEILDLAEKYLKEKIITRKYAEDALHIATATVYKIDVLTSWNFKHIVNLDKIHQFNAINLREGYSLLEIRTPKEVIPSEKDL